MEFLLKHEILSSESELKLFLKFNFAKYEDKLQYSEFLQLMLPNKKKKLR